MPQKPRSLSCRRNEGIDLKGSVPHTPASTGVFSTTGRTSLAWGNRVSITPILLHHKVRARVPPEIYIHEYRSGETGETGKFEENWVLAISKTIALASPYGIIPAKDPLPAMR